MRIFLVLLISITLSACASRTSVPPTPAELWQLGKYPVSTPLQDDERIVAGQLPNGLRYYLVQNQTPKNEISVRMRVNVGSLDESDTELGMAHLLEHMAFNGSKNVPEGEMVAILERFGLSFGADTNASTSFHETIYMLDLPTNNAEIIDTSLFLMREAASNLTLSESAVAAEIPVVLAEYDVRNTLQFKAQKKQFNTYTQGMRYADRWAIGTKDAIRAMNAPQIRDFYERFYTPSNTHLIIVGDFDVAQMQAEVSEHFADWQNANVKPETQVGSLTLHESPQFVVHQGPGLPTQILISHSQMTEQVPDSIKSRRDKYVTLLANSILNYRLSSKLLTGKAAFDNAYQASFNLFEQADIALSVVGTSPDRWESAMAELVNEIQKIQTFGVTIEEVNRQISSIRNGLYTVASESDTLPTKRIAQSIIESLDDDRAILSPDAELALFEELMVTFSVEEINQAIQAQFSAVKPVVYVQSNDSVAITSEQVKTAFTAALNAKVTQDIVQEVKDFAYTDFGSAGEVSSRDYIEAYDITNIVFANGLRLNVKPTQLVTGQVQLDLRYGDGYRFFTAKDEGLKELYGYMVAAGLGEHNVNELRELVADKDISLGYSPRFHSWGGTFSSSNEHLLLQLQLMAAYIVDPAWDPALLNLYRQNTTQQYQLAKSSVNAVRQFELQGVMYDGDIRVATPALETALTRTFAELQAELNTQLNDGSMTLSIVGDVDVNEVIAYVAKTFGTLPYEFSAPQKQRVDDIALNVGTRHMLTHQGNPDNAVAIRLYQTADNVDTKQNNTLNILSEILKLKVTDKLREELGAAYSPSVFNTQSRYIKNDGFIQFVTPTSPDQLVAVENAYQAIITQIQSPNGITEDELARAVEPLVAGISQALEQNGFWLNRLGLLHIEPDAIDRWFALEELLRSITLKDVREVAKQYLRDERMIEVQIVHESVQ